MNKTERKNKREATGAAEAVAKTAGEDQAETGEATQEELAEELLDLDEIKELIELVAAKDFNEFELQRGRFRLRLMRGLRASEPVQAQPASTQPSTAHEMAPAVQAPAAAPVEEALHIVTSPIVGTYYSSSSPNADTFFDIGDKVESGQTLCIIEAMKLMNEIQSDAAGTIVKVFVENGQPVEFGQPLFGIRK